MGISSLITVLIFCFQNCSESFKTETPQVAELSSQCDSSSAKLQNQNDKPPLLADCNLLATIQCDVSIFSPQAESHTEVQSRCDLRSELCTPVTYYFFNTLTSRADLNSKSFEFGGEYNRREYRCFYTNINNEAVQTEQGDTLLKAFNGLVKNCPERNKPIEIQ